MISSTNIDNRKKDILILGKGLTQRLEHTLSAEKTYSINFIGHNKKFVWACIIIKQIVIHLLMLRKFKAKDFEIVATPLCLGKLWKDFSVDNIKKIRLNGYIYDFRVGCDAIAVDDVLEIHKYLVKKKGILYNVWICQ